LGEGNFIAEGPVRYYDPALSQSKGVKSYLILFEDQLVIAKRSTDLIKSPSQGKLKFNQRKTAKYSDAKTVELKSITSTVEALDELIDTKEKEFGFRFFAIGSIHKFAAKDKITRGKWVKDINTACAKYNVSVNK